MRINMKKRQIYTGVVERVDFPNKAVVKAQVPQPDESVATEYAVVKGALPGQTVEFSVKKARKNKCEGRLRAVLKKGQLETREAKCPNFGTCGGCNYQEIPYEQQLALKKEQVLRLIDAVYEGDGYQYDGILSVRKDGQYREWGYRNKMEFSFGDAVKDGPLTLGLHKKGSFHDIVDAEGCQIVHPDYSAVLACVREYAKENNIPYYHKRDHQGVLRHLLVRRAEVSGDMLVALVTSTQQEIDYSELVSRLLALPLEGQITGILQICNDSLGDVVQSDETKILYGKDWFEEKVLGLTFKISPFSFFQTNTSGAEVLYQRAREYVLGEINIGNAGETSNGNMTENTPGEENTPGGDALNGKASGGNATETHTVDLHDKVVFDLYSGTGTIAQLIAPVARKVIGVEIVEEAVEAAKENAALNGLDNCEFIAGDVLKVIDDIEEKPDYIILDPPRDGIHPKALQKIIDYGVKNIVYISCKPTSFARDLAVFQERGYELKRVSNVDLFPETVHVETVVLLSQQKPDDTIEIDLDLDELDATSAETKATYQEIKDYVLKEFGLKVSNLYISQIKRKCGIEVGENYNLPKTENPKVPQCPKEKEDAIKAALKYFAMI
jgi:23S rRNA (uracil1939-C5)-methyltransferase